MDEVIPWKIIDLTTHNVSEHYMIFTDQAKYTSYDVLSQSNSIFGKELIFISTLTVTGHWSLKIITNPIKRHYKSIAKCTYSDIVLKSEM